MLPVDRVQWCAMLVAQVFMSLVPVLVVGWTTRYKGTLFFLWKRRDIFTCASTIALHFVTILLAASWSIYHNPDRSAVFTCCGLSITLVTTSHFKDNSKMEKDGKKSTHSVSSLAYADTMQCERPSVIPRAGCPRRCWWYCYYTMDIAMRGCEHIQTISAHVYYISWSERNDWVY